MEIFEATLALLAAALLLSWVAGRFAVPYPSFLVLGGLVLGFLPILPRVDLDPAIAFAVFLPPILFEAAYWTSWRDFRANARPIFGLAVVLVGVTTWAVAKVAGLLIPELPAGSAIVLGAIVSPPDAAAATAVMRRMRLPRRLITIVEGESLVNDAAALVIYNFSIAAVVTGHFSASESALALARTAGGGVLLGLLVGWAWTRIATRTRDPLIGVAASFLVAFSTYLAAERLGVSGVLAVVSAGLFFAWRAPESLNAETRLQAGAVWSLAIFILNALAFVLIGLQLPQILEDLAGYSILRLLTDGAIIAGTVIAIRLAWVAGAYLILRLEGAAKARRYFAGWRELTVIGWSGMRGLVSLAAALALPGTIADGSPFPARALILFLAFSVVFATLVVQGLTLGGLIRLLEVGDDGADDEEERLARIEAATAAICAIDSLAENPALPRDVLDRLRILYVGRIEQADSGHGRSSDPSNADFLDAARLAAIAAEREAILRLRHDRKIGDVPMHKIERELDLLELTIKRRQPTYSRVTWIDLASRVGTGQVNAGRPEQTGPAT